MNEAWSAGPPATKRSRRRGILVGLLAGLIAFGSIAFAQWLINASGDGVASASTPTDLVLSINSSGGYDLYPGGTGRLEVNVANDNDYDVVLDDLTQSAPATSDTVGCDGTNVTFNGATNLNETIPGNGATDVTVMGSVSMLATAPQACIGAVFTIPLTGTGHVGS